MKNNLEKTYRYSLRKLKVGAASVAVASMVWLSQGATVHAEEIEQPESAEQASDTLQEETSTQTYIEETTDTEIVEDVITDSSVETIEETTTLEDTVEVVEENTAAQTTESVEETSEVVEESTVEQTTESVEETTDTETVEDATTDSSVEVVEETTTLEDTVEVVEESTAEQTTESVEDTLTESTETEESDATLSVQETNSTIDLSSLSDTQSSSISIVDQLITILTGGEYTITGTNEQAQVVVDSSVTEHVVLTLENAILNTIYSASKTANVTIVVPEGTESTVADDSSNTNKGAIQVKGDLEITGSGTLSVIANSENAHAIKVGDSLTLDDVVLYCYSAMKDGIHTDETVTINNATITINALQGDGIQVEDDSGVGDDNNGNIVVNSGFINIASSGQSLQATNDVTINDGTLTLTSLDSEGIEGRHVIINGGTIVIESYDDGINATDFTTKDSYIEDGGTLVANYSTQDMGIEIHGGSVTVTAGGDGIDSNGYVLIDGGEAVIVSTGSSDATSSAIDHDGTATINGGTVWLLSTYNGMIETFDSGSQSYVSSNVNGNVITIKDSNGNVVDTITLGNTVSHVIYSSDSLTNGQSYTVNNSSTTATSTRQMTMGPMGQMSGQGFPMAGTMPQMMNNQGTQATDTSTMPQLPSNQAFQPMDMSTMPQMPANQGTQSFNMGAMPPMMNIQEMQNTDSNAMPEIPTNQGFQPMDMSSLPQIPSDQGFQPLDLSVIPEGLSNQEFQPSEMSALLSVNELLELPPFLTQSNGEVLNSLEPNVYEQAIVNLDQEPTSTEENPTKPDSKKRSDKGSAPSERKRGSQRLNNEKGGRSKTRSKEKVQTSMNTETIPLSAVAGLTIIGALQTYKYSKE